MLPDPGHRMLLDGAMGTALISRGLDVATEPPDLWNVTRPDDVRDIHRRYLAAGADALHTNTFSANRIALARFGMQERVRAHNIEGALLARAERGNNTVIIGDLGATDSVPPPEGNASLWDLEAAYTEQARALTDGGVDMLHVETTFHPKAARAAIRGCRQGSDLPVVVSMSCRRVGDRFSTVMGFPASAMLKVFTEEKVDGIGLNCNLSPLDMLPLVGALRSGFSGPLFVQPGIAPDSGPPLYPEEFAGGLVELLTGGATAVGGCCGTGEADIRAARASIDSMPAFVPRRRTQPMRGA